MRLLRLFLSYIQAGQMTTFIYENGQFTSGPDLPEPMILAGAVALSLNEVLVFNGFHRGRHDAAYVYNFSTGVWTDVGPSPAETYYSSAALIKDAQGEDLVFIIGNFNDICITDGDVTLHALTFLLINQKMAL